MARAVRRQAARPRAAEAHVEDRTGGISYLLSVKHSYLEQTSQLFYPYIDDGRLPLVYGRLREVDLRWGRRLQAEPFWFNFNDNASVLDDSTGVDFANYGWNNIGGGAPSPWFRQEAPHCSTGTLP